VRFLDILAKPFRRAPRETAADRAAWIDSAVRGMAAQAHHAQLSQLRTASRSFEAGETPAWVSSWATTAAGINEGLLRIAVGLEAVEDLQADLERGLSLI